MENSGDHIHMKIYAIFGVSDRFLASSRVGFALMIFKTGTYRSVCGSKEPRGRLLVYGPGCWEVSADCGESLRFRENVQLVWRKMGILKFLGILLLLLIFSALLYALSPWVSDAGFLGTLIFTIYYFKFSRWYYLSELEISGDPKVVYRLFAEVKKRIGKKNFHPPKKIYSIVKERRHVDLKEEWEKWREVVEKWEGRNI